VAAGEAANSTTEFADRGPRRRTRCPRIAGREIDFPQDPRQGKSRSVGDERTAVLALSDGAEDTRRLRRSSNGAAGRPVLLLVVRTSGTPVRAVRGDLDPLPRCVVGLAVPRKTRGGRLVRTLRGVQSVPRRSRQAIRRLGAIFSPARELTRPPPGLVLAEEPAATIEPRRKRMFAITVPRSDVTSDEVADALRQGLESRYNVLPGEGNQLEPSWRPAAGSSRHDRGRHRLHAAVSRPGEDLPGRRRDDPARDPWWFGLAARPQQALDRPQSVPGPSCGPEPSFERMSNALFTD
jgi:hypothetical protein